MIFQIFWTWNYAMYPWHNYLMKKPALILLIVLFSALCSPITIIVSPSDNGTFVAALDVCNSSGSFMSVNGDSPAIQEYLCTISPLVFLGYVEQINSVFTPSFIISKQERPPQV